jgi:hypothetical protein
LSPSLRGALVRIISASVEGKKLIVVGENFDRGAVILRNRVEQARHDPQNPQTALIGDKVGKKIKPDDMLQVRNPNGSVSRSPPSPSHRLPSNRITVGDSLSNSIPTIRLSMSLAPHQKTSATNVKVIEC